MFQLAVLGIMALGGGLLFIYIALNRPAEKRSETPERTDGGGGAKVIYLFGPEGGRSTDGGDGTDAGNGTDAGDGGQPHEAGNGENKNSDS
jgi:hypothetical protein